MKKACELAWWLKIFSLQKTSILHTDSALEKDLHA
jgi:hypothetical protein